MNISQKIFWKFIGITLNIYSVIFFVASIFSLYFGLTTQLEELKFSIAFLLLSNVLFFIGNKLSRIQVDLSIISSKKWLAPLTVVSVWILFPLIGVIPYLIGNVSLIDALFNSYGSFVTAAPYLELRFLSLIAWSILQQWFGGLGIVFFSIFLLGRTYGWFEMIKIEGIEKEGWDIRSLISKILFLYVIITIVGVFLLIIAGMSPLSAIFEVMAAVCTGTLREFPKASFLQRVVLLLLSLAGGVGMARLFGIKKKTYRRIILTYIFYIGLLATIFSVFQGVRGIENSILLSTTTAVPDIKNMHPAVFLISLFAIFVGGMVGSPSGGIKFERLLRILSFIKEEVKKATPGYVAREYLKDEIFQYSLSLVLAYLFLFFLSGLVFSIHRNLNEALLLSASFLSDVYVNTQLAAWEKILAIFLMIAGRLGVIPLFVFPFSLILFLKGE